MISAVVLSILCGACGPPSIAYYRASPRKFCPQTSAIKIEWFTDGDEVTLTALPPVAGLGEKKGRGTVSIKPAATSIQLDAGDKYDRPKLQLDLIESGETALVGSPAIVCGAGFSVGEVVFEAGEYAPEVVVRSLENRLTDREIVVTHLGRAFTLPPGTAVPLQPETPNDPTVRMAHAWVIRVPHLANETCSSSRVRNPGMIMNLECAP
jgi:hypothetical protein